MVAVEEEVPALTLAAQLWIATTKLYAKLLLVVLGATMTNLVHE